jgi:GH15 family glucan-1,4-alpha-glucosidase
VPRLIEDYALIGDLRTAALVGRDGSVDWLCLPRFDAPAVFAAMLGDADHGRWLIAPDGGGTCSRRHYRDSSLVLETEWVTADGAVKVIDFMPPTAATPGVVRIVEGIVGEVRMRVEVSPRMGYGRRTPTLRRCDDELVASADGEEVGLLADVPLLDIDGTWKGEFAVSAGQRICFTLVDGAPGGCRAALRESEALLTMTEAFWLDWTGRCTYDGPWEREVKQSLVFLKALTYAPTGAIVAAATTSLPELVGGARNWDYRYCWLRDSTFTLRALLDAGYVDEAVAWREWLHGALSDHEPQIMYGIAGERDLTEQTLPWLPGFNGSAPVRAGNHAATQDQGDVWGEVLDVLEAIHAAGAPSYRGEQDLFRILVERIEETWQHADRGLWEVRGAPRHFVHSKLMAWVGADRALHAVDAGRIEGSAGRLRALRDAIRDDVCAHGFDVASGAFTQSYGVPDLDAAALLMPRYGFLAWDDPRMVTTVSAIERHLTDDGLVLRYATDERHVNVDGLLGGEGTFLPCSFWFVDALRGLGRTADATELFERLLSLRNDVGMLSEEFDPVAGTQLGNTPQALSHAALVTSAVGLAVEPGIRVPRTTAPSNAWDSPAKAG